MKKLLFLIICLLLLNHTYAQENIPIGTWRTHLSFNTAIGLALGEDVIYCATGNGFFIYDTSDNSLEKFSATEGLSDNGLSSIAYHTPTDQLFVGYQNGNIDIIKNSTLTNIDDIKNAGAINNDKNINHVLFEGNQAFIATGFGILIFDLDKSEIRETIRNLGGEENGVEVYKSVIFQDSLFLATEVGILAAPANGTVNLLDFNNWKVFDASANAPETTISSIAVFNEKVIAAVNNDGLHSYDGNSWQKESLLDGEVFHDITTSGNQMLVSLEGQLVSVNETFTTSTIAYTDNPQPKMAIVDESQSFWIADGINGLVSNVSGGFESLFPSGPFSDATWRLYHENDKVYSAPGGYSSAGFGINNTDGFSVFQNGSWDTFTPSGAASSTKIPEVTDIVDVAFDPRLEKSYFASFGSGLLVQYADDSFSVIDDNTAGSPLVNLNSSEQQVHISALSVSNEGLWVGNHGASTPIHLLKNEGGWDSFSFEFNQSRFPVQIAIAGDNNKWVRLNPNNGGGILVFDSDTGENRYLTEDEGSGGLPDDRVNDIAFDQDGLLWAATDKGIAFFPNPFEVLSANTIDAFIPRFEGRELFADETVTSIEIDGGNRKWMATNNGVWLFDANLDRLIHNFNEDNSPLLSNNVIDIKVNDTTGEVFFATDQGIIAFRSTATSALPNHGDVKIFPNPVTRQFSGLVGISGLALNAIVKITDISGKLIWQTRAEGGTATWNVADYNGNRAETGVYMVFSATDDGSDTYIGKIAVVN